jgi:hypothetical protein
MAFTIEADNVLVHGPISATMRGGLMQSEVAHYLISGTSADFGTAEHGPSKLLANTGITVGTPHLPAPGEQASVSGSIHERMFVTERTASMLAPTLALVTVRWETFATELNGPSALESNHITLRTTTVTRDGAGDPLTVTHGDVVTGAQVSVMDPQISFKAKVLVTLPNLNVHPTAIMNYYVGRVNSGTWRGAPAGYWLCTGCVPIPINVLYPWPIRYAYDFSFVDVKQSPGWQPVIEWKDDANGLPADGLTPGTGRKTVTYYTGQDFDIEPQAIADGLA